VAPVLSFWGATNRWAGLRTEWMYGVLFLLGAALLGRPAQLERLAGAVGVAGVGTAAYAVFQWKGPAHPWVVGSGTPSAQDRPFGTLGNPIFLADLALLGFFLALGALLAARSRVVRGLWALPLAAYGVCLVLPQSRGAWVGAAVGAAALGMQVAALRGAHWRYWLVGPPLAGPAALGALWVGQGPLRASGVRQLVRLADVLNPAEAGARSRLLQWQAAWMAWLDRPFLGYGPDTFESIIERYWSPELQRLVPKDDILYDRAHNAVLDALVSAGGLGGLALLLTGALVGWSVVRVLRHYRDERAGALSLGFGDEATGVLRQALLPAAGVAGLVAYLTAQQFSIQTVASSSIAWLLAGGLMGMAGRLNHIDDGFDEPGAENPGGTAASGTAGAVEWARAPVARWGAVVGGAAGAALAVVLAIQLELRPMTARLHDDLGVALHNAQRLEEAVAQEEMATRIWPHNFRHWAELAYARRALARPKPTDEATPIYRAAVAAAERAVALDPVYPRVLAYYGDVAGETAARTGDALLAERASAAHTEATTTAPLSWRYREMAGQTYFQLRRIDDAKAQLAKATEYFPESWTLWAAYGDSAVLTNDRETARRAYEAAQKLNPTHEGIQRALAALG
jgi:O-antigen ligase/Flp pilus assembly protein TadD